MTIPPNSNAECERVFSHMKKIQTSFRSELSNDTISSILATKLNNNKSCIESIPEKTTLRKVKLATKSYTNEHKFFFACDNSVIVSFIAFFHIPYCSQ